MSDEIDDDNPALDDTPKEDETSEDEIEDAGREETACEDKTEDIAPDDALSPEESPPHPLNSKPLAITQGSILWSLPNNIIIRFPGYRDLE